MCVCVCVCEKGTWKFPASLRRGCPRSMKHTYLSRIHPANQHTWHIISQVPIKSF